MAQSLTGSLRTKATQIVGFTAVIWAVFVWDWFSTSDLSRWGLCPVILADYGGYFVLHFYMPISLIS